MGRSAPVQPTLPMESVPHQRHNATIHRGAWTEPLNMTRDREDLRRQLQNWSLENSGSEQHSAPMCVEQEVEVPECWKGRLVKLLQLHPRTDHVTNLQHARAVAERMSQKGELHFDSHVFCMRLDVNDIVRAMFCDNRSQPKPLPSMHQLKKLWPAAKCAFPFNQNKQWQIRVQFGSLAELREARVILSEFKGKMNGKVTGGYAHGRVERGAVSKDLMQDLITLRNVGSRGEMESDVRARAINFIGSVCEEDAYKCADLEEIYLRQHDEGWLMTVPVMGLDKARLLVEGTNRLGRRLGECFWPVSATGPGELATCATCGTSGHETNKCASHSIRVTMKCPFSVTFLAQLQQWTIADRAFGGCRQTVGRPPKKWATLLFSSEDLAGDAALRLLCLYEGGILKDPPRVSRGVPEACFACGATADVGEGYHRASSQLCPHRGGGSRSTAQDVYRRCQQTPRRSAESRPRLQTENLSQASWQSTGQKRKSVTFNTRHISPDKLQQTAGVGRRYKSRPQVSAIRPQVPAAIPHHPNRYQLLSPDLSQVTQVPQPTSGSNARPLASRGVEPLAPNVAAQAQRGKRKAIGKDGERKRKLSARRQRTGARGRPTNTSDRKKLKMLQRKEKPLGTREVRKGESMASTEHSASARLQPSPKPQEAGAYTVSPQVTRSVPAPQPGGAASVPQVIIMGDGTMSVGDGHADISSRKASTEHSASAQFQPREAGARTVSPQVTTGPARSAPPRPVPPEPGGTAPAPARVVNESTVSVGDGHDDSSSREDSVSNKNKDTVARGSSRRRARNNQTHGGPKKRRRSKRIALPSVRVIEAALTSR